MLGWVGEFEAEVSSISSEIHKFYLLNMEVFKSKEFTIAREWLRTKGLQLVGFQARYIRRKSRSLILPFTKILTLKYGP